MVNTHPQYTHIYKCYIYYNIFYIQGMKQEVERLFNGYPLIYADKPQGLARLYNTRAIRNNLHLRRPKSGNMTQRG